jgi:hypothetical protein
VAAERDPCPCHDTAVGRTPKLHFDESAFFAAGSYLRRAASSGTFREHFTLKFRTLAISINSNNIVAICLAANGDMVWLLEKPIYNITQQRFASCDELTLIAVKRNLRRTSVDNFLGMFPKDSS